MIQKLTTSTDFSEEPVWVNLDQILKITRLEPSPIVASPSPVERPCKRSPDVLIVVWHEAN
jgi:hypothetical protein